jgi:hypothetical protein
MPSSPTCLICGPTFDSSLASNCTNMRDCCSAIQGCSHTALINQILPGNSGPSAKGFPPPEDLDDSPNKPRCLRHPMDR